jgi:hypothetical protein
MGVCSILMSRRVDWRRNTQAGNRVEGGEKIKQRTNRSDQLKIWQEADLRVTFNFQNTILASI